MIPIRDHRRTDTTPIVTNLLLAINVGIFIFMFLMSSARLESFVSTYALVPAEIVRGEDLYALITSMFLHGGIGHIFSNMIFLHVFGDNLEDKFGHIRYLLFYLVSGLGASALQILVSTNSTVPNIGASGAIAGLLGGYLILFPDHRIDVLVPIGGLFSTATVPAQMMLLYWIVFQFLQGFGTLGVGGGGVAYFAHIGGFVTGLIITLAVRSMVNSNNENYI